MEATIRLWSHKYYSVLSKELFKKQWLDTKITDKLKLRTKMHYKDCNWNKLPHTATVFPVFHVFLPRLMSSGRYALAKPVLTEKLKQI